MISAMILVDAVILGVCFALNIGAEIAICLGAIATATAPAATLMVIHQYKAKGPLVDLLLPVVAFDTANGIKDLLKENSGILISNRDKENMKEEIIKLFNESTYRKKISNNGYKNCKKYLPSNVRKMWIDIFKGSNYEEK